MHVRMTFLFRFPLTFYYVVIVSLNCCVISQVVVSKDSVMNLQDVTEKQLETNQDSESLLSYEKRQRVAEDYLKGLPKTKVWINPHEMISPSYVEETKPDPVLSTQSIASVPEENHEENLNHVELESQTKESNQEEITSGITHLEISFWKLNFTVSFSKSITSSLWREIYTDISNLFLSKPSIAVIFLFLTIVIMYNYQVQLLCLITCSQVPLKNLGITICRIVSSIVAELKQTSLKPDHIGSNSCSSKPTSVEANIQYKSTASLLTNQNNVEIIMKSELNPDSSISNNGQHMEELSVDSKYTNDNEGNYIRKNVKLGLTSDSNGFECCHDQPIESVKKMDQDEEFVKTDLSPDLCISIGVKKILLSDENDLKKDRESEKVKKILIPALTSDSSLYNSQVKARLSSDCEGLVQINGKTKVDSKIFGPSLHWDGQYESDSDCGMDDLLQLMHDADCKVCNVQAACKI